MFITDLPPELRYSIYKYYFADVVYNPIKPLNAPNDFISLFTPTFLSPLSTFSALTSLLASSKSSSSSPEYQINEPIRDLSEIYSICKSLMTDPWLTRALLTTATFHLNDDLDILMLQARFDTTDAPVFSATVTSLSTITQISLSASLAMSHISILHLQSLMPNVTFFTVEGTLTPLHRVWDLSLSSFKTHPWSRFIACLCVFAPQGVPGMQSPLVERVLTKGDVRLRVRWEWEDAHGCGKTSRMQFDTKDWVLRWKDGEESICVPQVRVEELEGEVERVKEGL